MVRDLCIRYMMHGKTNYAVSVDDAHAARRRYKKDLDQIKPDLVAYNRQKEVAMGLAPGTLVTSFNPSAGSSSSSSSMQVCSTLLFLWSYTEERVRPLQVAPTRQQQQIAADDLYRDANSMLYGDSKPSEDAIDRVVGKINQECVSLIYPASSLSPLLVAGCWLLQLFPLLFCISITESLDAMLILISSILAASTRRANFRASVSTKTRAISLTLMSGIGCSTRRYVFNV